MTGTSEALVETALETLSARAKLSLLCAWCGFRRTTCGGRSSRTCSTLAPVKILAGHASVATATRCDRRGEHVRIQAMDRPSVEPIGGQCGQCARFQSRIDHVGRTADLSRHNSEVGPWSQQIRTARSLGRRKRGDEIQKVRVAHLPVDPFGGRVGVQVDLPRPVDDQRRSRLLPDWGAHLGEELQCAAHGCHAGARNLRATFGRLFPAQPVNDPQAHQVRVGPQLDLRRRDAGQKNVVPRPPVNGGQRHARKGGGPISRVCARRIHGG